MSLGDQAELGRMEMGLVLGLGVGAEYIRGRAGMWRSGQGSTCWPIELVRPFLAISFAPFPGVAQDGATPYPFLSSELILLPSLPP